MKNKERLVKNPKNTTESRIYKENKPFFGRFSRMIKQYVILALYIGGATYLFQYGWWVSTLWVVFIVLARLWIGRDQLMPQIHYTETLLFGKPLDKEFWDKGEKPKMKKAVWGKK